MCRHTIVLGLIFTLAMLAFAAAPAAAAERVGEGRAIVVRLVEVQAGDREYLGVVLKMPDAGRTFTLLMPRKGEVHERARRLKPGQVIAFRYVLEAGRRWLTRFEVVGKERKGEGEGRHKDGGERRREDHREGEGEHRGDR